MNQIEPEKLLGKTMEAIDRLQKAADRTPTIDVWRGMVAIKHQIFHQLISEIRETLPQELEKALEIIERRNTIIENAKREHEAIIEAAKKRQQELVSQQAVLKKAELEARRIIEQAREEAEQLRLEALRYSLQNLESLEDRLSQTLSTIRNGIRLIQQELGLEPAEEAVPAKPSPEEKEKGEDNHSPASEPTSESEGLTPSQEERIPGGVEQSGKGVE